MKGFVLLKLYALPPLYRQGDAQRIALYETDVLMLAQRYRPDIRPLLETLRPFVDAGQLQSLSEIVGDIERRISRMGGDLNPQQ